VHVRRHGPRPVEGHQGGDVVEAGGGQGPHERPHGAALELEHADRLAPAEQGEGVVVVEVDVVDVDLGCRVRFDQLEGVSVDDVEVAQAEEVHLEQAQVLDPVHLVLGDDRSVLRVLAGLGLALDGQVLGEGLLGDHHRGGVDAVLAAQALEARPRR
jgi:hypothetical protein